MRRILVLMLSLFALRSGAQDTLYFKNKEKVTVLLLEVNPDNLKYKRFDNQAGATYTVLKTEVDQIVLSNGKKEVFTPVTPAPLAAKADTSSKGQAVAQSPKSGPATDTLLFKSGKKTPVKIYELTPGEVKYKPMANLDGPIYKVNKSEIKEIIFSTGLKQTFNNAVAGPVHGSSSNGSSSGGSYQLKGTNDARTHYKNMGGSIGTGAVALIFPLAGLIPAAICSSIPPKQYNLGYPDDRLWQNPDYRNAYSTEAYRIKRKRVWTGFGIGSLASILLAIVLTH